MNEEQEKYILYCLSFALAKYPKQQEKILRIITHQFNELKEDKKND